MRKFVFFSTIFAVIFYIIFFKIWLERDYKLELMMRIQSNLELKIEEYLMFTGCNSQEMDRLSFKSFLLSQNPRDLIFDYYIKYGSDFSLDSEYIHFGKPDLSHTNADRLYIPPYFSFIFDLLSLHEEVNSIPSYKLNLEERIFSCKKRSIYHFKGVMPYTDESLKENINSILGTCTKNYLKELKLKDSSMLFIDSSKVKTWETVYVTVDKCGAITTWLDVERENTDGKVLDCLLNKYFISELLPVYSMPIYSDVKLGLRLTIPLSKEVHIDCN